MQDTPSKVHGSCGPTTKLASITSCKRQKPQDDSEPQATIAEANGPKGLREPEMSNGHQD